MLFLKVLDIIGFCSIGLFALWNWFQAVFGSTNIEFLKQRGLGINKGEAKLRFDTISDNLYRIFGTHKFFRVFSPSFRNVPFTGLEWSFRFKDEGFDCDGLLPNIRGIKQGSSLNPGEMQDDIDEDVEMI